jgi:hypothetical protein
VVHDRGVGDTEVAVGPKGTTMNDQLSTNDPRPRRRLSVGLAGGLLAGTAAGLVFGVPGLSAATDVNPTALVQQADEVPADDTRPEPGVRLREALQVLVDDGTITADQADAVASHLVENRPERGQRGEDGRRPLGKAFGMGVGTEVLTDLLGIDAAELRTQLRDGATLAEIATDQGVEVQAVVDELVAEVAERLDNAVENGRLDQARADEKLAEARAKIAERVENGRPDRDAPDTED